MRGLLVVVLVVLGGCAAPAQESSAPPTADRSNSVRALPPESNDQPFFAMLNTSLRAEEERRPTAFDYKILETMLYDLGIHHAPPTGRDSPRLSESIRSFQTMIGRPATGTLLVSEVREMERRHALSLPSRFGLLPPGLKVSIERDVAQAEGAWFDALPGATLAANKVSIRCERQRSICVEAVTYLRRASGQSTVSLDGESSFWTVVSWAAGEIVAQQRTSTCLEQNLFLRDGAVNRQTLFTGASGCPPRRENWLGLTDGERLFGDAFYNQLSERDQVRDPRFR